MIKKIVITVLIISIVVVGGSLAYLYGKRSAEKALRQEMAQQVTPQNTSPQRPEVKAQPQEEPEQERGIPVKVARVIQEDVQISQTFYGTAIPFAETNIQGERGGKIVYLKGKEGDVIQKGELVAQFDDSDTRLELQRAIAGKNTAIQAVNQAQSNLDTIQANVDRNQKLFNDGLISQQQLDNLRNQFQGAQAALNTANETVKQADAQMRLLENVLADFRIAAPIGGVISEKRYNLSEVYQSGTVLYHLMNIDKVYVEIEVAESYIGQLKEKMEVDVFFDSLEGQEFRGTIERILPKGDSQSRNFIAKALVDNTNRQIKPGMFARIDVNIRSIPKAFRVDSQALNKHGEGYSVFKVVDSQVEKVPVSLKLSEGNTATVISEDLQSGDQIVIEGTRLLQADTRIKIL